jgi:hypothetical protein
MIELSTLQCLGVGLLNGKVREESTSHMSVKGAQRCQTQKVNARFITSEPE